MTARRAMWAHVVALVSGIAVFARSLGFEFVYDDHWTVENVQLGMPLMRLLRLLLGGAAQGRHIPDATRPSMVVSVWIDRRLFGDDPMGFHADSLLLYGVVCALALSACLALTGRLRIAWVAALVFALAPLHTEVVCAINYREDLIAAIGMLVPLACLVRARPTSLNLDLVVAACFGVGLFGKESATALVPIVVVLAFILPKARARILAHRRLIALLAVVFVMWGIWRWVLAARGDDIPRAHYANAFVRLEATARYCVRATLNALIPLHPSAEYERQPTASAVWFVPVAALVVAIGVLARKRMTRVPAAGLAIMMLAPLPASPLFAPVNELADRYVFVGVLGAGLVWGWLISRLPPRASALCAGAVAVVLAVACQSAAAPWKRDRTLWADATQRAPTSPRAWVGLSRACRIDGDLDEADRAVDHALELDPKFITAHVTRAYNRIARGDMDGARRELAVIHDLGGDEHAGVARAARCVTVPPTDAPACIR